MSSYTISKRDQKDSVNLWLYFLEMVLEALSKPTPTIVDLLGIPYKIGVVTFKTLKVNEIFLDLSLTIQSDVSSSKEDGVYIYDKYTFIVD